MKYTKLGSSDLTVSRICMGCMGFGDAVRGHHSWTFDEARSREIIKRGLELGACGDTPSGTPAQQPEERQAETAPDNTSAEDTSPVTEDTAETAEATEPEPAETETTEPEAAAPTAPPGSPI